MSIGENVNKRLKASGKTQTELAKYCAVGQPAISKIIYGKMPSVPLLTRIAEFLGCSVDDLLCNDSTYKE